MIIKLDWIVSKLSWNGTQMYGTVHPIQAFIHTKQRLASTEGAFI